MSQIKLLLDVVENMRSLADSLQTLADAVVSDEEMPAAGGVTEGQELEAGNSDQRLDQNPAAEPEPAEPDAREQTAPSLEEVRRVLAQKSRSGYTAQVREMLIRHGADRLSAIDPKEYAAMLAEAEVLK